MLQINRATIGYGGRPVLHGVSLTVWAGEIIAILGANGSGKSTLVRAALGLVGLQSGTVHLFGTPLHPRGLHRWRLGRRLGRQWRRIGFVPQRLGASSGVPATVREVVASGRLARRGLLRPPRPTDRARVDAALAAVGLSDRAGTLVGNLSGGQQQRALIARALAGEPELLVLDEPTAGVDAGSQDAFAEALRGFAARGGTVLLVAHELGPLAPLITRAVVVHDGGIGPDGGVLTGHEHVHPHAPEEPGDPWGVR